MGNLGTFREMWDQKRKKIVDIPAEMIISRTVRDGVTFTRLKPGIAQGAMFYDSLPIRHAKMPEHVRLDEF